MTQRWLIVYNRDSGKRRRTSLLHRVKDEFSRHGQEVAFWDPIKDPNFPSKTSLRGWLGVVVIGGDGSVHQVVNALKRQKLDIPVGVIPVGTGNDFARNISILQIATSDLVKLYLHSEPREMDLLQVEERYALQVLSTGFDARISQRARRLPRFLGSLRYVAALLIEIPSLTATQYRINVDGIEHHLEAMFLAVCNGKYYGNGMKISPYSKNDDGVIEVVALLPVSRRKLLFLFPKVFSGSHITHPSVLIFSGDRVSLSGDTICEADGEAFLSEPLEMDITTSRFRAWVA